jgi:hypothetical protein
MDCPFSVGDEVVCCFKINARDFYDWEVYPQVGAVYVVREIVVAGGLVGIRLVEIVNRVGAYSDGRRECAFHHRNFRRVEKPKRETSIEVFRKIDRDVFGRVPA